MPRGIRLVIVGGGPDSDRVREEVSRLGIEARVTMLGRVRRDELHAILRICDLGVLMYPFEGLNNIYCAPNKLFEYAQAGLPVLATDQPPLSKILAKYDVGVSIGKLDEPRTIAAKVASVVYSKSLYRDRLRRFLSENTWADEAARLRSAVLAVRVRAK
jgi:glycosyltransferase involved in cell wall biosynthesis